MSHADVHHHDRAHTHHADETLVTEDEAGNLEAQIIIDALQNLLVTKNLLAPEEVTQETFLVLIHQPESFDASRGNRP